MISSKLGLAFYWQRESGNSRFSRVESLWCHGLVSVWLVWFLIAGFQVKAGEPAAKPNVLIMVADDLGYSDVGFNGGTIAPTPHLDRLAATGVKLTDFRACPMCSPTRAGLITGRWPLRFGIMRAVIPPWSRQGLPTEEQTLPELLARAGYDHRAIIGKWHLGHARREFLPLNQGFNFFYGHYNGAIDYFTHEREGEVDWHRNEETIKQEGYSTDLLAEEAAKFIRSAPPGKPWLLYLPWNAPHSPFQAPEADLNRYEHLKMPNRRAYAAMVDRMDLGIGHVLEAIEARKETANTCVIFFSDNGGVARVGSNAAWRGAKLSVYEGGTRVCAVMRWPAGGLSGGKTFHQRVGYIDVLPTMLAVAGASAPADLDGLNFLPALRGDAAVPARPWFSYIHQDEQAHASVHEKDWKLIAHGDVFSAHSGTNSVLELYNLASDPAEQTNTAGAHPEVVKRLQEQLLKFGALQRPGVGAYAEGREGYRAPKDWIITE